MLSRTITTFLLFGAAFGFNILSPHATELINVDEYYNLTWTTEGLLANSVLSEIRIACPDPAVLYAADDAWVYSSLDDESYNISALDGFYAMDLAPWWSPFYNDLPHINGSWSISMTLSIYASDGTRLDDVNDTVPVMFTSPSRAHVQRPRLAPLMQVNTEGESGSETAPSPNIGIWPVILSISLPIVLLFIIVCFLRIRWRRHAYGVLSPKQSFRHLDLLPSATSARSNEKVTSTQVKVRPTKLRRVPKEFLLAAFLTIIPLAALLTALVSLLLIHKVTLSQHKTSNFSFNESFSDPAAFYMDYDATRYNTIASWTSSIALLLPGFLTSLLWYHQTNQLESDATRSRCDKLLTPHQLALLLGLKSGTLGSLWDYIMYIVSRRREKQAKFLFEAGFVVLISTMLGLGLWLADTWLHVETSTVSITSATSFNSSQSWVSLKQYGRVLTQNCSSDYLLSVGQSYSCLLLPLLADIPPTLKESASYSSIISERNDTTTIKSLTLDGNRIAYLAPPFPRDDIDYRASTCAVRSVCQYIDRWCNLPLTIESPPWIPGGREPGSVLSAHCGKFEGIPPNTSEVVYGTVLTQGIVGTVTSFFIDQRWEEVMTVNNTANSFYMVSRLDASLKPGPNSLPAHSTTTPDGVYWSNFIGCNTELVSFTYTYVNGSVRAAEITPLNDLDLANAIYLPTLLSFNPLFSGGAAITASADDVDSAMDVWADTWHKSFLGLAAIATTEVDNIDQQQRFSRLVARIPKAPLFTLGTLLVLSILFNGFVLVRSLWKTNLGETNSKQMIVSIAGLTAHSFDNKVIDTAHAVSDKRELFEESHEGSPSGRVGIGKNSVGGPNFVAFVAEADFGRDNERRQSETREQQSEMKSQSHAAILTETAGSDEISTPSERE